MQNVYFGKECISVEDGAFEEFCNNYSTIHAGGGLVKNSEGNYLLIFRRGVWDLPKGKLEPGESIENCALREVQEETGLDGLILGSPICVTHHSYSLNGTRVIKHTHWFNMQYNGNGKLIPQTEEQIEEARWVKPSELEEKLSSTFPSIREVFANAGLL